MNIINKNKKAYFSYIILEDYIAGIQLLGSEVKSIKASKVSISESHCLIHNGEMFIRGMHVSEYKQSGKYQNHELTRERKLLLNKSEIVKIGVKVSQKGMTLIPLNIHTTNTGLIKIKIGLGKGKKLYDKKMTIKERDLDRDTERGV